MSRIDGKIITQLQVKRGVVQTINAQSVTVYDKDAAGNVLLGKIAGAPSNGGAGYAIDCQILDTTNKELYLNQGTAANAIWESLGSVDAEDIETDAVDSDEIKANAVGNSEMGDSAVGAAELINDSVGPEDLADGAVEWVSVDVTAAEVKALGATPKTLVAAPVAGKYLEFISASLALDYGSEAFAEDVGGSNLGIKYENAAGVQVSEDIEMTGFIEQVANTFTRTVPKKDAIVAATGCVAKALVLDNIGAGEIVGNASNDGVLRVKVAYRVLASGL